MGFISLTSSVVTPLSKREFSASVFELLVNEEITYPLNLLGFQGLLTALKTLPWLCFGALQGSLALVLSHSPRRIKESGIALRSGDLSQSV